jgi:hypothetical protein
MGPANRSDSTSLPGIHGGPEHQEPLHRQAQQPRLPQFTERKGPPFSGTRETWVARSISAFFIPHPPSAIRHPPSPIRHPPSPIPHPPSAIRHLSSAIRHLPSAISSSPFPIPHSAFWWPLSSVAADLEAENLRQSSLRQNKRNHSPEGQHHVRASGHDRLEAGDARFRLRER